MPVKRAAAYHGALAIRECTLLPKVLLQVLAMAYNWTQHGL
jgi:hypothetical protein